MENKLCGTAVGTQLLLVEEGVGRFATVLRYGDGAGGRLPVTTSAEDLIATTEIDYRECRKEIRHLRYEYPLFEQRLDIPVADFEDLVTEAVLLPSMLQETDSVGFFVLGGLLHQSLQREDDGTASFLLYAGEELLYILEDSIRVQTCLRNIFEMAFDGMERVTQQERFEKLSQVYSDIGKLCDPASLSDVKPGQRVFRVESIFGLWMLELVLYFQKDKRLKRNLVEEQDGALRICNQPRDRVYARFRQWQDAAPDEWANLIPIWRDSDV